MNKTTLALALGTGLALGLATGPRAHAAATTTSGDLIQTLDTQTLSANDFNSLFTPYNTAILSPFTFSGAPADAHSGLIESQVFQGTGKADGLYAYAYQVAVGNTPDSTGLPPHVDSTSFTFNATPMGTDLTNSGKTSYGYVVKDGQVGGLNLPGTQSPTTLSWQPAGTTGFIRAQYVDPATQTSPLNAGTNSATFVLITNQLPSSTTPSVNVGGAAATTTVPVAYSASGGTISPVPVPEPATFLAWSGMAAAVALVRRFRKARTTHA